MPHEARKHIYSFINYVLYHGSRFEVNDVCYHQYLSGTLHLSRNWGNIVDGA